MGEKAAVEGARAAEEERTAARAAGAEGTAGPEGAEVSSLGGRGRYLG